MLMIAWTTVASAADADRLAASVVEHGLAACVQIDGPVTSHYRWNNKPERSTEFRLTFKCLSSQIAALEIHVVAVHPYAVPEWLVVSATHATEKYLSWARTNSQSRPL